MQIGRLISLEKCCRDEGKRLIRKADDYKRQIAKHYIEKSCDIKLPRLEKE